MADALNLVIDPVRLRLVVNRRQNVSFQSILHLG